MRREEKRTQTIRDQKTQTRSFGFPYAYTDTRIERTQKNYPNRRRPVFDRVSMETVDVIYRFPHIRTRFFLPLRPLQTGEAPPQPNSRLPGNPIISLALVHSA